MLLRTPLPPAAIARCTPNRLALTTTLDCTTAATAATSSTSTFTAILFHALLTTSGPRWPHARLGLSCRTPFQPLAAQFSFSIPPTTTYFDRWSSTHQSNICEQQADHILQPPNFSIQLPKLRPARAIAPASPTTSTISRVIHHFVAIIALPPKSSPRSESPLSTLSGTVPSRRGRYTTTGKTGTTFGVTTELVIPETHTPLGSLSRC